MTNLAILGCRPATPPVAPLTLSVVPLRETQPLLACGYPLGALLASGKTAPSPTWSPLSVGALRRDPTGRLLSVQFDGALNPGNSGGPMCTTTGEVAAVVTSGIPGTRIASGIPVAAVASLLAGKTTTIIVDHLAGKDGQALVQFTVEIIDPKACLATCLLLIDPVNSEILGPQIQEADLPAMIQSTMSVPLVRKDEYFIGTATLRRPRSGNQRILVQTEWTCTIGGPAQRGRPAVRVIDYSGAAHLDILRRAQPRLTLTPATFPPATSPPQKNITPVSDVGARIPDLTPTPHEVAVQLTQPIVAVARGNRSLALLQEDRMSVVLWDLSRGEVSRAIQLPATAAGFAAGGNTLLTYLADADVVMLYPLTDGIRTAAFPFPSHGYPLSWAMGWADGTTALVTYRTFGALLFLVFLVFCISTKAGLSG